MQRYANIIVLILALFISSKSFAENKTPVVNERGVTERLVRLETKIDAMDKRLEDMNKRFEDINSQLNRMSAIFTTLVVAVIGFAIWDRRTMVRPFEDKVRKMEDDISENKNQLHSLILSLRDLSKTDSSVAEVLKRFNLL
ncbi:MAG: hypothetical protein EPN22_04265 [Nitrospirae bacterium]|nr:MAG: hypothetical protein EPN22_04265 [Nitrospirota bacterium]